MKTAEFCAEISERTNEGYRKNVWWNIMNHFLKGNIGSVNR